MFVGTDNAARRTWIVSPNRSPEGHESVAE
jgi:hypothetical protein